MSVALSMASVKAFNMAPEDYDESVLNELELAVSAVISEVSGFQVTHGDNIIFTFPQDPSVKTMLVPILVEVDILFFISNIEVKLKPIAMGIRDALWKIFPKRGNIVVKVQAGGLVFVADVRNKTP